MMKRASQLLCIFYGIIAVAALYGTWSENLSYPPGTMGAQFLTDLKANPASRSISIDIALFLLAAAVWMVLEARRIGVRFVWAYVAAGFLIAISVAFPLFLIARELRLASADLAAKPAQAGVFDLIGIAVITILIGWLAVWLH